MSDEAIYQKIHEVFEDIFEEDVPFPTADMTAEDVDGWDSLSHVRMIIAVEAVFGVRFSTMEIANLQNVGDLVSVIAAKD